jgi:hypothetical protein
MTFSTTIFSVSEQLKFLHIEVHKDKVIPVQAVETLRFAGG